MRIYLVPFRSGGRFPRRTKRVASQAASVLSTAAQTESAKAPRTRPPECARPVPYRRAAKMLRQCLLIGPPVPSGNETFVKAPREIKRKLPCGAHFSAQIERTSGVSCAQAMYRSMRRWGRPMHRSPIGLRAEVAFTSAS